MAVSLTAAEHAERWTGRDVSVAAIERELALLRDEHDLRTNVMTHLAWAQPEWQDAARETLAGLAEQHPSRTILLFPQPDDGRDALDADLSLACFSLEVVERHVCSEVIELRLHGDRREAPASIVVPLLLPDLPVFLRWRGQPPFGARVLEQLLDVVDRLVVDSREWDDLPRCYAQLVEIFDRVAVSDIAWARTLRWRRELASLWPELAGVRELHVRGPLAEAALLAGWLRSRLRRDVALRHDPAERIELLATDGREIVAREERSTASELLSHELDRFSRDPVYESAAAAAAA